jgi:PAS domain S-box-containing protein
LRRPRSIRAEAGLFVLALSLPIVGLVVFTIVAEYKVGKRQAEQSALQMAEATAVSVRHFLSGTETILSRIARWDLSQGLTNQGCYGWRSEVTDMLPRFSNLFYVSAEGRVICSAHPLSSEDPLSAADQEYFRSVLDGGSLTVGKPREGLVGGRWVSVVGYPVREETGRISGAVALTLDLVRFQELLEDVKPYPDAVITIADFDGVVVARSPDPGTWVGRLLPRTGAPTPAPRGITRTESMEGVPMVWGYSDISVARWRVFAGVPAEWVYGPIREAALGRAAAALGIFLLAWGLAGAFYTRIAGALRSLVWETRSAQAGTRVEISPRAPLEILKVADQFNRTLRAREEAEGEVRRAVERYRSILHNAVFGIYLSSPDGRLLEVNPAFVRMMGYASSEEMLRIDIVELYRNPEERDALLRKYRDSDLIEGLELEWKKKDGTTIWVELNGRTIQGDQGETVFEMIVQDVTKERVLESQLRQSQKMEAVGRLAAGVAHDFNNILTVITGRAQLLMSDLPEDSRYRFDAGEIARAAERAVGVTNQLLAFGRKQVVRPRPLDLNELVQELDPILQSLAGAEVRLTKRLDADLRPCIADPSQVEQVIMNLVVNARDAMAGGGEIRIATGNRKVSAEADMSHLPAEPGEYAELSVEDTGEGIQPSILQLVFEPFFTTKPEGVGTGLGLSTVYGIVSQAGGGIHVQSTPRKGTTLTVLFPAVPTPVEATQSPEILCTAQGGRETILVVDDEEAVRSVVCTTLRRKGYAVLEAEGGPEAISVAEAHGAEIDLLLTDVVMPNLRGPDLAERLAVGRPGLRVLFISGHTDENGWKDNVAWPSARFLRKPFTPDQMLSQVQEVLGNGGLETP